MLSQSVKKHSKMYYNSSTSLLSSQLRQNYARRNGNQFYGSTQIRESTDEHEIIDNKCNIGPGITLHNCLNQLEKCTVANCALNIFDNVVVKEELIIDDYEDSESVIENYFYDSFEKWSEFGQPLKTFLQNSNFKYHVEENYFDDKMLEDSVSNNSSYDGSFNSLAGSTDKTVIIRNQEWALEKVFKDETIVKSYLEEQNWSLRVRYNTQCGTKSLYRCNLVKSKMPQCEAKVAMEYNKKSKSFLVYNNRQKHTHGSILLGQSSLDRDVCQKVKELKNLGLSKFEIQLHLENNGYNLSSESTVNTSGPEPEPLVKPLEIKPKMELLSKAEISTANKWKLERKFASFKFALQYMKQTGIWGTFSKKRGHKTDKQYFRCNRVRKVGPQCAAQKYLLIDHVTGGASLYGINEHTHDMILSMNGNGLDGERNMENGIIKKESESDCDNDDYYGNGNDESSATSNHLSLTNKNSRNNENKLDNDNSNDRLSSSSADVNKNSDHFWILNRTFKTGAIAKLYLGDHKIWKVKHRELNGIGLKCIYRCGLVDAAAETQCAAMAYAQYHAKNGKVFFYTNSLDHTHASISKDDSGKKCNTIFRSHPTNNELNSHIKNDIDCTESKTDSKPEASKERHSLRPQKPESPAVPVDTATKASESETSDTEYIRPKSKRSLPWKLEKRFDKLKDAYKYMENKPSWYMWKKQNFRRGGSSKSYYKCTVKTDSIHCNAQKHLFVDKENNKISIYRCHSHTHEPTSPVSESPIQDSPVIIEKDKVEAIAPADDKSITVDNTVDENAITTESSNSDLTQRSCSTKGTWGNNWKLEKKFANMKQAVHFMKAKEIWSICGKLKVLSGYRQYYRCNLVKKSGPQCEAKKYLFFNTPTKEVLLYGCNSHTHELILSQIPESPTNDEAENEAENEAEKEAEKEAENEVADEGKTERRYVLERKFKNLDFALSYIKEADTWTHHSTLKLQKGERRYYVCKLRSRKNTTLKCAARCALLVSFIKQEVSLYKRPIPHTHPLPCQPAKKRGRRKKSYGAVIKPAKKTVKVEERSRAMNAWNVERNFINAGSALKYMKREKIWSIYSKRRTNTGNDIQYYRCNVVKKTGPQCAAQKYLLFHFNKAKVSLYGRNKHTHDKILAGLNPDESSEEEVEEEEEEEEEVEEEEVDNEIENSQTENNEAESQEENSEEEDNENENDEEKVGVNNEKNNEEGNDEEDNDEEDNDEEDNDEEDNDEENNDEEDTNEVENEVETNVNDNNEEEINEAEHNEVESYEMENNDTEINEMESNEAENDGTENTNDETYDEPLNENLYAVDVVIEEEEELRTSKITYNEPKPKRGRGLGINYVFEKKFRHAKTALNYLKSEKMWSVTFTGNTSKGYRQRFRCNLVSRKGPQCAARKYLIYDLKASKGVQLYSSIAQHTHEEILSSVPVDKCSSHLNNTLSRATEEIEEQEPLQANIKEPKKTGKKPRTSWKRKVYSFERKFKNAHSAKKYMKSQKEWGLHAKTKRKNDMKQYYRCNYVKVGGPQCQAGKFLLMSNLKKEVSLFYCNNHTHESILQNLSNNESANNTHMSDDDDDDENEPIVD